MTTGFSTRVINAPMEATHVGRKIEEEKGTVTQGYQFSPRIPHPMSMGNYQKWSNDAESSVALNVLTDITVGVGYHTEMPKEEENKKHDNKKVIDDWAALTNVSLDEKLQEIAWTYFAKGFCPIQILKDNDYEPHILPPETFYVWQTITGETIRYTQERSYGDIIRSWEKPKWQESLQKCESYYPKDIVKKLLEFETPRNEAGTLDEICLFFHRQNRSSRYGKSLLEPIGSLLDGRAQLNVDMMAGIHRWANPIPIMETSRDKTNIQKALEEREVDEWVLIGNVMKDEVRFNTLAVEPAARFLPYVELIYYQICEGLHAPLLLYLKNATEASATVMMESVDRLVNGVQRYIKRRVEHYFFEPQVGKPTPRLIWGQPKTGLEKFTGIDIAALYGNGQGAITFTQVQDLIKKLDIQLVEPSAEELEAKKRQLEQPKPSFQPFQKASQPPIEAMIERLNDLNTNLNIIETNYSEHHIAITEACRLADRAITVHMKRIYPNDWEPHRDEKFQEFVKEKLLVKAK